MRYILISCILLFFTSCKTKEPYTKANYHSSNYNIALLLPLSGSKAELGERIKQAVQLSVQKSSTPVNLVVIDTGSEDEIKNKAAYELKNHNFKAIIGPLFGKHALAVRNIVPEEIPIITLSNDASLLNNVNLYISGLIPEQQVARILDYASRNNYKELYAFLPYNQYGMTIADEVKKESSQLDYKIKDISYYHSKNEIKEKVGQLIDIIMPRYLSLTEISEDKSNPKGLLLPNYGNSLKAIMKDFYENKTDEIVNIKFLGINNWNDDDILSISGLQGSWLSALPQGNLNKFKDLYYKSTGNLASDVDAIAYDISNLILNSLAKNNINIVEYITRKEGFEGASGTFRFEKNGLNQRNFSIFAIQNHQLQEIEPANNIL